MDKYKNYNKRMTFVQCRFLEYHMRVYVERSGTEKKWIGH